MWRSLVATHTAFRRLVGLSLMYLIGMPLAIIARLLQIIAGFTILIGAGFADKLVRKPTQETP